MTRRIHDAVARRYNSADGIIAAKNRIVVETLRRRWAEHQEPLRVADLGVGDGALLEQLCALPVPLRMTGLDVSPAMLEVASRRVAMTPVLASAEHAAQHLPRGEFDLVLSHFILAYVPRRVLLEQARHLLAPDGVLSLVSSTNEGAAALELRLVAWATDRAFAASHVPRNFDELAADLAATGLQLLDRQTLRVPVTFHSPDDAFRFGIDEGWAVNVLAMPGVPVAGARALTRYGLNFFDYPFEFTQTVEILQLGRAA